MELKTTRGGSLVRVSEQSDNGNKPIKGYYKYRNEWIPTSWTRNGFYRLDGVSSSLDLLDVQE